MATSLEENVDEEADRETGLSEEDVSKFLSQRQEFAKRWFVRHVSEDTVFDWLNHHGYLSENQSLFLSQNSQEGSPTRSLADSYSLVTSSGRNSVTSELFHDMISHPKSKKSLVDSLACQEQLHSRLRCLGEPDLLMELIRDIANELDINTLCHKILVNVGILTNSDRGSLFLAKGSRGARYLVAKLFDVTQDSVLQEALEAAEAKERIPPIPFGVGIAGCVAETKNPLVIQDAYQDPRFNKEIDVRTGYRTVSMMCLPILNFRGDVIGVAQCINKVTEDHHFTEQDQEVFRKYLTFCGIGIQNAQLFEMSVQEFKRNQLLLGLAKSIFEETSCLEKLISRIMKKAKDLLLCEKCCVYLVDVEQGDQDICFSTLFELRQNEQEIRKLSLQDMDGYESIYLTFAQHVVSTKQTFNWLGDKQQIADVKSSNTPLRDISLDEGATCGHVLSIPIFSSNNKIIGVAQLVNKLRGQHFTDCDINTLEAFAIFCGLGIYNTQMYENAVRLMAKQKVALEVLSYHASSSIEETKKLMHLVIPPAQHFDLYNFSFSDFPLTDDDTCKATVRMFLDLDFVRKFRIPYQVLCRWVLSVRKNYRPVIYHNWRHALNVAQTMFCMLTTGQMKDLLSDLEALALLVACLCHDLDHRGTNNSFQSKIESPLATLYSTSTMEHHHFDQCIMILNSEGNNIFRSLSAEEYKRIISIVESAILSTDLALYFKKKDAFLKVVELGNVDWKDAYNRDLLRGMMMTACDVSAICKPWKIQRKVAELVASEFFEQGDLEKERLKEQPVAMMDREKKDELPKMQVGFVDCICMPVYQALVQVQPKLCPLLFGCQENRSKWQQLADEYDRRDKEINVNHSRNGMPSRMENCIFSKDILCQMSPGCSFSPKVKSPSKSRPATKGFSDCGCDHNTRTDTKFNSLCSVL